MRTKLSIMVVAAALITGCGTTSEEPASITGQAPTGRLPTGAYGVVDITGASRPPATGADTAQITLTFGPGTLAAATGCNTITGQARLDGDRLTVSDPGTTDLPCGEKFVAVQRWLAQFLDDRPTVAFDGELLTLATTRTTVRLRPTDPAGPGAEPGSDQLPRIPRTA